MRSYLWRWEETCLYRLLLLLFFRCRYDCPRTPEKHKNNNKYRLSEDNKKRNQTTMHGFHTARTHVLRSPRATQPTFRNYVSFGTRFVPLYVSICDRRSIFERKTMIVRGICSEHIRRGSLRSTSSTVASKYDCAFIDEVTRRKAFYFFFLRKLTSNNTINCGK